jgi:uncharacterized OsmC-like protein
MASSGVREYTVHARSTDTFGRVLASCRDQHFVVDGPVDNGCPGEAATPAELFLGGIAACGVELLHVIARDRGVAFGGVEATVRGSIDRANPVRSDVTVFSEVRLDFRLRGVATGDAGMLVEAFKGR